VALVVLIGMPGSGKSTLARAVAGRLGRPYLDTDEVVASREGKSPAELIREYGEGAFRAREFDALESALSSDAVVATGGGVVTIDAARERLASEPCVYLRATPEQLIDRVGSSDRPLLEGDRDDALARLFEERDPLYRALAQLQLDASSPLADLVTAVCDFVGGAST